MKSMVLFNFHIFLRFFCIGTFLLSFSIYSAVEVTILDISLSGKSLVIDLGSLEGVGKGHIAKFYLRSGDLEAPDYSRYGRAEATRVYADRSFWFIETFQKDKLKRLHKGDKIIFLSKNETLKGSRAPRIKKLMRVKASETGSLDEHALPEHIFYRGSDYSSREMAVFENKNTSFDDKFVALTQFSNYSGRYREEFKTEVDHNFMAPVENVDLEEYKNEFSIKEFESITNGSVSKLLEDGHAKIYHWQKENKVRNRVDKLSIYDQYKEKKLKDLRGTREVDAKIKRDGELWSADLDDAQLRDYILRKGIISEKERRQRVISRKSANELFVTASSNMTSNTSSEDSSYQAKGHSVEIGYEYHLQRRSISLQRFSVEAAGSWGVEGYEVAEGVNGHFQTASYMGGFNWYIHNYPTTVNDYMLYIGTGIRKGEAIVNSESLSKKYNYQISALPIFYLGFKYRYQTRQTFDEDLPVGFGFNFRLSREELEISSFDTFVESDQLYGTQSFSNVKMTVGLSLYF